MSAQSYLAQSYSFASQYVAILQLQSVTALFQLRMAECGCNMSARWLGSSELTKRLRRMRVQSLKVIYYAVVVSDSSVTSYTVSRERFVLVAFNTWLLTRVLPRNIFCGLRLTSRHTC